MKGAIELGRYFQAHAERTLMDLRPRKVERLSDRIRNILKGRPGEWCTRTDIQNGLGRNALAEDVTHELMTFETAGLAEKMKAQANRTGRPPELWRWVGP